MKLVKDIQENKENLSRISDQQAEEAIKTIIEWIGEDPSREGLKSTPKRVVKAFKEYFKGYKEDPKIFLNDFLFLLFWRFRMPTNAPFCLPNKKSFSTGEALSRSALLSIQVLVRT